MADDETVALESEEVNQKAEDEISQNGEREKSKGSRRDRRRTRSRSPRRSRSRSRSPRHDRSRRGRIVNVSSTRVVVKNMPYELKWQDIKDLFRKEVGDVAYVEMIEGNDGKPRGMAVIEFKDKDAARKAIETMHQYKVHDRYLVVNEERDKDRRLFQQIGHTPGGGGRGMDSRGGMGMGGGGGGGGMGMGGGGGGLGLGGVGVGLGVGVGGLGGGLGMGAGLMQNNLGLGGIAPEILAQLGIEGPVSNTVFIANLDYKVGNHKLREVFKLAGNVLKAEIKEDKNGKSRGMGTVTFEHPMEAVQAVSMFNGQTLYDRKMIVRMDKVPEETQSQPAKLPSGLKSIGMGLGLGGSPLTNISQISSMASTIGLGAGLGAGLGGGLGTGSGLTGSMGLGMDGGLGTGAGLGGLSGLGASALNTGLGTGLGGSSGLGLGNLSMGSGLGGMGTGLGMSGDLPAGLGGLGKGLGSLGLSGSDMMGTSGSGMGVGIGSAGSGRGEGYGRSGREERGGQRVTRPDNCTVLVRNLPYAVTWQDLRERFQEIGEVKYAEIKMEKGRSTGQGLVRFSNEDDAARAINNLDQTRFEGRTIEVRMYRG